MPKETDKAIEAVKQAVSSPLLETTIENASHVIINISGDISLIEANEAASYVQELAGDDANIIFGAMYDENAQDEASITVIATGLDEETATPVAKAMTNFGSNPFQKKQTSVAAAGREAATAAQPSQAGFRQPSPSYKPSPSLTQPGQQEPAPAPSPAPSYRPMGQTQINIPDFLKHKR